MCVKKKCLSRKTCTKRNGMEDKLLKTCKAKKDDVKKKSSETYKYSYNGSFRYTNNTVKLIFIFSCLLLLMTLFYSCSFWSLLSFLLILDLCLMFNVLYV